MEPSIYTFEENSYIMDIEASPTKEMFSVSKVNGELSMYIK